MFNFGNVPSLQQKPNPICVSPLKTASCDPLSGNPNTSEHSRLLKTNELESKHTLNKPRLNEISFNNTSTNPFTRSNFEKAFGSNKDLDNQKNDIYGSNAFASSFSNFNPNNPNNTTNNTSSLNVQYNESFLKTNATTKPTCLASPITPTVTPKPLVPKNASMSSMDIINTRKQFIVSLFTDPRIQHILNKQWLEKKPTKPMVNCLLVSFCVKRIIYEAHSNVLDKSDEGFTRIELLDMKWAQELNDVSVFGEWKVKPPNQTLQGATISEWNYRQKHNDFQTILVYCKILHDEEIAFLQNFSPEDNKSNNEHKSTECLQSVLLFNFQPKIEQSMSTMQTLSSMIIKDLTSRFGMLGYMLPANTEREIQTCNLMKNEKNEPF